MKRLLTVAFLLCVLSVVAAPSWHGLSYGRSSWQFGAIASSYTVYMDQHTNVTTVVARPTSKSVLIYNLKQGKRYWLAVSATMNGKETPKGKEITFLVPLQSPKASSLAP